LVEERNEEKQEIAENAEKKRVGKASARKIETCN
jgi:hypothetical protein